MQKPFAMRQDLLQKQVISVSKSQTTPFSLEPKHFEKIQNITLNHACLYFYPTGRYVPGAESEGLLEWRNPTLCVFLLEPTDKEGVYNMLTSDDAHTNLYQTISLDIEQRNFKFAEFVWSPGNKSKGLWSFVRFSDVECASSISFVNAALKSIESLSPKKLMSVLDDVKDSMSSLLRDDSEPESDFQNKKMDIQFLISHETPRKRRHQNLEYDIALWLSQMNSEPRLLEARDKDIVPSKRLPT